MAWAPDYATVSELASYVRIDDADDDAQLALAITAASRAIDQAAGRQFGKVDAAEQRQYRARPDYELGLWMVDVDDYVLVTGTGVIVSGAGSVTTYVKEPFNASAQGRPWTRITFTRDSQFQPSTHPHDVLVTAIWGWSAVPTAVKQACLLQASRFFVRRNAPFGVAGSPDMGSELRLLARVDPDVAVILRDYTRPRRLF